MQTSFEQLGLDKRLIAGLAKTAITVPTPVQTATIPAILNGQDAIGDSATGTGKTLAYLLPLFQKVVIDRREVQGIILAPTHELVMQIFQQAELLAKNSGVPVATAAIVGNANVVRQLEKLKEKPHLLVGSAGRLLELIQKRKINVQTVKTIVLDEADRLLDEKNLATVAAVIKTTQKDRQLLLFSATINAKTIAVAGQWLKEPFQAELRQAAPVPAGILHMYFPTETRDKIAVLRKLLASIRAERSLVFVNTAPAIAETVSKLNFHGVAAAGLHGSADKRDRQQALADYRAGRVRVLVASDLAARGLDIADLDNVINLDLPETPDDYLHRAGRTGRCDAPGRVFSIVDRSELRQIRQLQKKLRIDMAAKQMSFGKIVEASFQPAGANKQ
ncbi:MAG: DEAD/DEAH box helicase [Veillonellaceae bacterium]|nr:DEAD/DEAH box helicase [Veillonellaceae bacterium]